MDISVIIPVYESEEYLRPCLDSLIGYKKLNIEVICVYDKSEDQSLNILLEYEKRFDNLTILYSNENEGLSAARNKGLIIAKGKYIQFLDSDDELERDSLSILFEKAEQLQTDILYFNKKIVYESNWLYGADKEYEKKSENSKIYTGKELFSLFMQDSCFKSINAYTQFFKRSFLEENNLAFKNGIIYEDFHFFFFCAMAAKRVADLDEPLYVYRRHGGCRSRKETELHEKSSAIVLMEIWNYWNMNTLSKSDSCAIELYLNHIYEIWKGHFLSQEKLGILESEKDSERFLYKCLVGAMYATFSHTEVEEIRQAPKKYIYGAGRAGKEAVFFLEKLGIVVDGFVVTEKRVDRILSRYEVIEFDKLNKTEDALFIVAILNADDRNEIKNRLHKCGFHRIVDAIKP